MKEEECPSLEKREKKMQKIKFLDKGRKERRKNERKKKKKVFQKNLGILRSRTVGIKRRSWPWGGRLGE